LPRRESHNHPSIATVRDTRTTTYSLAIVRKLLARSRGSTISRTINGATTASILQRRNNKANSKEGRAGNATADSKTRSRISREGTCGGTACSSHYLSGSSATSNTNPSLAIYYNATAVYATAASISATASTLLAANICLALHNAESRPATAPDVYNSGSLTATTPANNTATGSLAAAYLLAAAYPLATTCSSAAAYPPAAVYSSAATYL
jgi:hypothetical protein